MCPSITFTHVRPVWEAQVSSWLRAVPSRIDACSGSTHAPALDEGEVESPAAGVLEFALGLLAEPFQLVGVDQRPQQPVLAPAALSSDDDQNRRSAARLAALRPRLACFGHGFAVTDPGRFADAVHRLLSAPS